MCIYFDKCIKIIMYTLVHIVRTDFLHHFLCVGIQRLMHLVHLYKVNYKSSSRHHEPFEQDETVPVKKIK